MDGSIKKKYIITSYDPGTPNCGYDDSRIEYFRWEGTDEEADVMREKLKKRWGREWEMDSLDWWYNSTPAYNSVKHV